MTKEVTYYGILKLCHYNQGFQLENAQIQQGSRIRKFLPSAFFMSHPVHLSVF